MLQTAMRVAQGIAELVEPQNKFRLQLRAQGFRAFEPLRRFRLSFCSNLEERAISERYDAELLKFHFFLPLEKLADRREAFVYRSDYIERLQQLRDEHNGVSEDLLGTRFPPREAFVRGAIHPCEKRERQFRVEAKEEYDRLRINADHEAGLLFKEEVRAGCASPDVIASEEQIHDFIRNNCEPLLIAGFDNNKVRYVTGAPAFVKELAGEYSICWTNIARLPMGATYAFAYGRPVPVNFEPQWLLWKGKLPKTLKLADFGLTYGFGSSMLEELRPYRQFTDECELKRCISAELAVTKLIFDAVERVVIG